MRTPGIRLHKLTLFGWAVVITAILLLLSLPILAGKIYYKRILILLIIAKKFKERICLYCYIEIIKNEIWK